MTKEISPKRDISLTPDNSEAIETRPRIISRRRFMAGAFIGIGAGLTYVALERDLFRGSGGQGSESLPLPKVETAREILIRIKNRLGIEIPTDVLPYFSREDPQNGEVMPNAIPTDEEAKILEETLNKIPGAKSLVQLVIPLRNHKPGAIAGGSYMGFQWPFFYHRKNYEEFPKDSLVSSRAAAELKLPAGRMTDSLPEKSENTTFLPLLEQASINQSKVKINFAEEVPWTTQEERLKQAIVHEFAHGLEDQIRLADSKSVREYQDRQGFYLFFNKNTVDINNPLLVSFGHLTGWKLVPWVEFARQYDPEFAENTARNYPDHAKEFVWDRDFSIWGDLVHRKNRLTIYASYGPIQEAFAEFWMASILYPQLLTDAERRYFGKIHEGLRSDPQKLIQRIVSEPNLLLS